MFSDLLELKNLSKEQQTKAISLSKKFSSTNKTDLEKANNLLFSLFCSDQREGVDICLKVLTGLKFNGNFNLWAFIQPSYCLKYYLTTDESVKEEITRMLREDVKSKWHDGEVVQSAQEELDRYIDDGIKEEYIWRVNLLIEYLYVLALGATGSLNKSAVMDEIKKNLVRLREIIKQ